MSIALFPWFEIALLLPAVGSIWVAFHRRSLSASYWSMCILSLAFVASVLAWLFPNVCNSWIGPAFRTEEMVAPMLPVLLSLHILTLIGISKASQSIQGCVRLLLSAAATQALFTAQSGDSIIILLAIIGLLPVWDFMARGKPVRGFLWYAIPFFLLLALAWEMGREGNTIWQVGLLLIALKLCAGIFPLHGWLPSLFQRASFSAAMLYVLPMVEVLAVIRLILPVAPDWMLDLAGYACLGTAIYSSALAVVQRDSGRFLGYLALSKTSLVMFAVLSHTVMGLTAALCLWGPVVLSLVSLGFSLRAIEARFGRLPLDTYHGHYEQVPGFAFVFIGAGLAVVGFPGTIGFVPMELLVSGSAPQGIGICAAIVAASMLNGIAILRTYFSIFTGRRSATSVSLRETSLERVGIVCILFAILFGGWFSPSVVESRHQIAEILLAKRQSIP